MRRMLLATALAGLIVGGLGAPAAAGSTSEGSIWRVVTYIHCNHTSCSGTHLLPPWMETLRNPFVATGNGHGHFYHRAVIIAIGRPGHPHRCDATLFSKPFSGRCVIHDFGIGFIKETPNGSIPGKPDFWIQSETATFNDGPPLADPFAPYPFDSGMIASPGHYSQRDLIGSPHHGVRAYMDVTRKPR